MILLRFVKPALLGICLCLAFGSAVAGPEPERWYKISVIVFSQPVTTDEDLTQQPDFSRPPNLKKPNLLPAGQSDLSETYQRLKQSRNYRPLLHQSWIQPALANRINAPYLVTNRNGVEGVIRLQRGQYLYVITDMEYRAPSGTHRLREKRRVLLNETHYFDHPAFGVLIRVSPVELPR